MGVENGVIFGFGGHFGVFLVILGSNPALFSFFVVTSPLRESVRVLAIAPHLLNVRVLAEARLGADSQEPLVGLHVSYVTI